MTKWIDTHCHLYDEAFNEDLDTVILRAKSKGVEKIILPAIDSSTQDDLEQLSKNNPEFALPTVGLHPTSVNSNWQKEIYQIEKSISIKQYTAIGEIGIDCYWSKDFLKEQKEAFKTQLEFASKLNLPVIIHLRDSTNEILDVLTTCKNLDLKGVFHAWSGSYETFKRIQNFGDFKIGIGGVITFKNSHLAEQIQKIPVNYILLETDAPWLTPTPHRGSRNEPSYLIYSAERVATVYNISLDELSSITYKSTNQFFNIS